MNENAELLRQFAEDGSQAAFAQLVARTIPLVYGAALRQTGGDAQLAQDVTQGVFLALACRAAELQRHVVLTGWLYTTTRFLAAKAVRGQVRRQRREQEAHDMNEILRETDAGWEQLRPVIDEAMHELGEKDRSALLLRFFEGRSLAEVGAAIGLAENAARMRVERALEKLRARLAHRGITSTATALGAALAASPAIAVPAGFAVSVSGAALAGAAVAGSGALGAGTALLAFMSTNKLAAVAAALIAVGALGGYLGAQNFSGAPRSSAVQRIGAGGPALVAPPSSGTLPSATAPAAGAAVTNTGGGSAASPALNALRVLMDLNRRKLVTPTVHLLAASPTGVQLTPEFTELFGLTADEQAALQRSIEAMRARLSEVSRDYTSVTRAPNGDVTLELKPFPEAGGAAYDTVMKSFAATLGAERSNAFLALEGEEFEKELGRFGTAQIAITFSREAAADGEMRYRIKSHYRDTPEHKSDYVSDRMTWERFVQETGAWGNLLPPDFGPPH